MDNYLTSENRVRMFNRLTNQIEDVENVEEFIKTFFDLIIPIIDLKVAHPYTLFKEFQTIVKDDYSRYILYEELCIYYLEDDDPYISFQDKRNLDFF